MPEGQSSAALNTDRELWREQSQLSADPDNYYAPSIHVTTSGAIGINVDGNVIVKPLREWHSLAGRTVSPSPEQLGELGKLRGKLLGLADYFEPNDTSAAMIIRQSADALESAQAEIARLTAALEQANGH